MKQVLFLTLLFFLLMPSGAMAAECSTPEADAQSSPSDLGEKIDTFHQKVSKTIISSALYFDDFFSDERFLLEDNQTRLMIRPAIGYEKNKDLETRLRISLRLKLPKAETRFSLLFTSNIDDENDWNRSALDIPLEGYEQDRNNKFHGALQYIYRATKRHNLRFSGGVRVSTRLQIYTSDRYRFFRPMENWDFRLIQRARWYSRDKWELRSTLDFDREFSKKYLFRLSTDWDWYEKEDNSPTYGVSTSLHQFLSPKRAIRYEWATGFESRPCHRVTSTVLSMSYRQRIWRDWLLYEITPQIAFPRDEDFHFTPGISLQFEIEFGYVKKNKDIRE
ncbi:MAG: hypothetical protein HUK40_07230 [Desulfobacter sp.]|nr:hypothetical protein [Desulfobacter sp.]WDP84212.1 MAG: hypothetical protein HUN05_02745 [Desulfobacter sp.]